LVKTGGVALMIVALVAGGTAITPTRSHGPDMPTTSEARAVDPLVDAPSVDGTGQRDMSVSQFTDQYFFGPLVTFLRCSGDWFAVLGGLLGYGDPLSRVATVANTCHPGPRLYALGRWIAGGNLREP
jgi:hypothetical protein